MNKIEKIFIVIIIVAFVFNSSFAYGFWGSKKDEEELKVEVNACNVTIKEIPKGLKTLFIPLKFDSKYAEIDKVDLGNLKSKNIVAVISKSGGKVLPGVGILKLDPAGIPNEISFKVIFKPKTNTNLSVSKVHFSKFPSLPIKGGNLNKNVRIFFSPDLEYIVSQQGKSSRLKINRDQLSVNIKREVAKDETFFIPIFYDGEIVDLKESKDYIDVKTGVKMKTYNAFINGGSGVELVLSKEAGLDFNIHLKVDTVAIGTSKFSIAYPQSVRTNLVKNPIVEITPSSIILVRKEENIEEE